MIQVPDGWEVKPFSSLASINMGQSPESEFVNENQEGIAFLQGNADFGDINPKELYWVKVPKKLAKKDDILISVRAPVGDINMADKEYCIGRGLSALTIKKINQKFGFYALFQERIQLDRLAQGSTFLAIGKNDFDKLLIKYPKEKKEQEKIAKILLTLDNAIESTNRIIEKEKNIKTALMQELLTNGIDKNGQIRTPQTHTYKPSELGLIPDEWDVVRLGKFIKLVGGFAFRSEDRVHDGVRWLKIANVGINEIKWDELDYLPNEFKALYKNFILNENDIVIAMTRPLLGDKLKISRISKFDSNTLLNQRVGKFIFSENVNKDFMYFLLQYSDFIINLMLKIIGTDPPNIGSDDIESIILPIPKEKKEQKQIAKILTTQDRKIEIEETNLSKLKELKKGLMSDLLSGEVRVKVL
jgi:type I restriction enzyme S subunit